jgi:predicted transcriptional regulator
MRMSDSSSAAENAAFHEEVARGVASAEAGRLVSYESVRRWILSWGSESQLEPPTCK